MDRDLAVLEEAAAAVMLIDRKYRRAEFSEQLEMEQSRDDAFNAYVDARLNLLKQGLLASAQDVRKMREIRQEIARARQTQSIVAGAIKLVAFLARFAV